MFPVAISLDVLPENPNSTTAGAVDAALADSTSNGTIEMQWNILSAVIFGERI
jgi:hypothetical protein